MRDAWSRQTTQNMLNSLQEKPKMAEAGFPAYNSVGGGYQAGNGPADEPPQIQTGEDTGFVIHYRQKAVAIFHTHPAGSSGLPSTASNHAGEGPGDTVSAIKTGKDIYVISDQGLSEAPLNGVPNPKYGKNNSPWIVQGNGIDKWLPKLQKQCNR